MQEACASLLKLSSVAALATLDDYFTAIMLKQVRPQTQAESVRVARQKLAASVRFALIWA